MPGLYERLTGWTDYRKLVLVPPLIALLLVAVAYVNGLEYGIDFRGGTWMDVLVEEPMGSSELTRLEDSLSAAGLDEVKAYIGYDVDTGKNKLTVQTVTVVEDTEAVKEVLEEHVGMLTEFDTASAEIASRPPAGLEEKLSRRLDSSVDVTHGDGTLTVTGLDLEEEELESALTYYLQEPVDADLTKKNFNLRSVGPTLGETFRRQGFTALLAALFLMGLVVLWAFKDPVPSVAVIQAAACDVLVAVGGMSLLGIPMEPASLAALLMLIGYSVDTDIMLTARLLREKGQEFSERVNDAINTGLTMTGTTLSVMVIVYVISTTLTQITTLSSIASVLIIGLVADVATTWFTNAGILRWYLEDPTRKYTLFKRRKRI